MTGEKITLRLKSDPSIELPAATVINRWSGRQTPGWDVKWGHSTSFFFEDYWEPVPPPYTLPTGIGAVVQDKDGDVWIRIIQDTPPTEGNNWHLPRTGAKFPSGHLLASYGPFTTLSEGVEL